MIDVLFFLCCVVDFWNLFQKKRGGLVVKIGVLQR